MTYLRKPEYVEALQYDGTNKDAILALIDTKEVKVATGYPNFCCATTDGFNHWINIHDWVVKYEGGPWLSFCTDAFHAMFEEV